MRGNLFRGVAVISALSLGAPAFSLAQMSEPTATEPTGQPAPAEQAGQSAATQFNPQQLDALLAPVALYPDALLVQVLMAATFPLQVVEASRWRNGLGHDNLQGDALAQALEQLPWDPSVKSIVPFQEVLTMLDSQLDWMQQLGYAFATQQADVMSSVQRLRHQAQTSGTLKTTDQQRVIEENDTIAIEPANPQVVYVPVYNPMVAFGVWPYPVYPPMYIPPPFGYVPDSAFIGGFAFATGVVVVGSLFGFARLRWHRKEVHIDVDRFNHINVNRAAMQSEVWRPPPPGVAGRPALPPTGPIGFGPRPLPMPANAMGVPNVQVPSSQMNRPVQPAFRPPVDQWNRPMQPMGRPTVNQWNRPVQPVVRPPPAVQRPVVPQHGGPPQRSGTLQPSGRPAFSMR
jgi:hypothetical protein